MKTFIAFVLCLTSVSISAQTIIGKWQLMKQSTCLETQVDSPDQTEDIDQLLADKNSLKTRTASVIEFKAKMKGEQSTTILGKRKDIDDKNFLYRFDGKTLHLLDKKSRTIITSYSVEEFSDTNLILSDSNRPCVVRVFERVR
jgi:hypothetical protein